MKYFFCFAFLFCSFGSFAQLSGVFTYKASISLPDTNVIIKQWEVRVYTNDTIVRVETETAQLGTQVYIRHIALQKAYLLLSYNGTNYAIQNDLAEKKDTLGPPYTFLKKRFGGKRIAGFKTHKYYVRYKDQTDGFYCYFAKKLPGKYLEVYQLVPGMALDYYLPSQEGLIHYELQKFEEKPLDRNLFGIPSDYKRISFDEFVNLFTAE